ncbi:MAG: hypothetical protein K9N11_03795 [Lentisphaeria bacterium]|nr:hypothetical protein [Candidatus Neomarinimicrobiota bacterium]MCF7841954.1 hypothetical protein [Lentisphaeria bacterium]
MFPVQLIPVSPRLSADDFRDVELLYEKLRRAIPGKLDGEQTVLVFPEYIGLGFYLTLGGGPVLKSKSLALAMSEMAKAKMGRVLWQFFKTYLDFFVGPAEQRLKRAIFQTYARDAWAIYRVTFENLAEAHNCWVVGGSILLPEIALQQGKWRLRGNRLFNQSVVFNPAGNIAGVTSKVHLTPDESGFVNRSDAKKWGPVETSWGKLAVLICADCWYPDMYGRALEMGATHYAVPAMVSPNTAWANPWQGYRPAASEPADIPAGLVRNITEAEAWERFGLEGRLKNIRHQGGVISNFKGQLLNLTAFGESKVISP